jgi:bzd-type benzoyl-CoA reductase N subunit
MIKGLDRAKEIYQNPSYQAKQLRANGKKVIGYLCIYPPLEMMTALGLLPYRIFGDIRETITRADSCLPTCVCPFLRSTLDIGLKGRYDFLDGVVMSHVCEVGEKLAHIWRTYLNPPYSFYIDTPHKKGEVALEYHRRLLGDFKKSLESFTGKELSADRLGQAIKVHNQQRALVRELYEMRKNEPPLISGVETLQVMKALMSIPIEEGNELLREVISEVRERKDGPKEGKRLLIWGSIIDDVALIKVIEEAGANVVMDDTCVGSRAFFPDVEVTNEPLDDLARRYLVDLKCPRTFIGASIGDTKKDYMTDLENRFGYLRGYASEWNVKGVLLYGLRYCDIHGYEVPQVKDYLDSVGLPSIYLEHDYSEAALAPLRTRVQAFLEVLG